MKNKSSNTKWYKISFYTNMPDEVNEAIASVKGVMLAQWHMQSPIMRSTVYDENIKRYFEKK